MASGLGRRFGSNKLLAEFHGKPMILHILEQTEKLFPRRVVVTRYPEIGEICRRRGIDCILHDLPGRNDTVRLGVEFFQTDRPKISPETGAFPEGYLFCPADQPLLTEKTLEKMAAAFTRHNEPGSILRLSYGERTGAPVLFDAVYAEELTRLPEKKGGSYLIQKYSCRVTNITAASANELIDVDTPDDLKTLSNIHDIS